MIICLRGIVEQFCILKIFQQSDSSHSYAWTSVVIPGPRHTVQDKFRNKATFTLNQLEIEEDYQVSETSLQNTVSANTVLLRFRCRLRMPSVGGKSRNSSLSEQTMQVRSVTQTYSVSQQIWITLDLTDISL